MSIIQKWENELKHWLCKNSDTKIVPDPELGKKLLQNINQQLKNINDIDILVIGDNPGKEEYDSQKYFTGRTTQYIRSFFKAIYGNNYENKVLFLNKSFVSSSITKKLQKGEDQKIMAEFIVAICKKNPKIKLWILGHDVKKFHSFFEHIKENVSNSKIYLFGHPSHNWFCYDFLQALTSSSNFKNLLKDFKKFGQKNFNSTILKGK